MFIIGLVFWIVAIIINYQLAPKRDRRRKVWVWLAILFGLFSTLFLAILPSHKPMKDCKFCTSRIPEAAIRCPKCHADLATI